MQRAQMLIPKKNHHDHLLVVVAVVMMITITIYLQSSTYPDIKCLRWNKHSWIFKWHGTISLFTLLFLIFPLFSQGIIALYYIKWRKRDTILLCCFFFYLYSNGNVLIHMHTSLFLSAHNSLYKFYSYFSLHPTAIFGWLFYLPCLLQQRQQ